MDQDKIILKGVAVHNLKSVDLTLEKNELFLVIDRLTVKPSMKARLFEAVERAADIGKGKLVIVWNGEDIPFNLSFSVESTGKSYPAITPHTFGFNTAEGMCPDCMGLGCEYGANLMKEEDAKRLTLLSLMRKWWGAFSLASN